MLLQTQLLPGLSPVLSQRTIDFVDVFSPSCINHDDVYAHPGGQESLGYKPLSLTFQLDDHFHGAPALIGPPQGFLYTSQDLHVILVQIYKGRLSQSGYWRPPCMMLVGQAL